MSKIVIDKRITVTGKKSVLHWHNPLDITSLIKDYIYLYSVTKAQNGLNIQSILSQNSTQLNCVELGGTLIHDTLVTGNDNFNLSFSKMSFLELQSKDILLQGDNIMKVVTPNISLASNNYVLTLIDSTTGECEWKLNSNNSQVNNGLNIDGSFIQLGGDLIEQTTINGNDTYDLNLLEIFKYRLTVGEEHFLKIAGTELNAGNGGVLTLIDPNTGLSEWRKNPINNIYNINGTLTNNRIVNGGNNNLNFNNNNTLNITNTNIIRLQSNNELQLATSNSNTSNVGDVLTLQDPNTGKAEWQSLSNITPGRFVKLFYITDFITPSAIINGCFDYTISASLHGKGKNPIVQVLILNNEFTGGYANAIVNTDQTGGARTSICGAITVNNNGDVTITTLDDFGPFNGKVIIM